MNTDRVISVTKNGNRVVLSLMMYNDAADILIKLPQDSKIKVHDFLFDTGEGLTYKAFFYEDSHKLFLHLKDLVKYISEIKEKAVGIEFYTTKLDVDINNMNVTVDEALFDFVFESMEECKNFLKWLIEIIFLKNLINFDKLFYYLFEWENQYLEVDEEFNIVKVHSSLEAYRTSW